MSGHTHGTSPYLAAAAPSGTAETASGLTAEPPPGTAETASGRFGEALDTDGKPALPGALPRRGPAIAAGQITVALIDKAEADLQRTHDRTRLSKTDIVNRALSLYEFIDAELSEGAELIVRRHGRNHLLKLL